MQKNTFMERGLSHVLIIALVALMALGAAVATTLKADAVIGATIDVTGADYDGDLDGGLVDIDDPSDVAATGVTTNFSPNGTAETVGAGNIDLAAATVAGSGLLHRSNAVGGIVDFLIDLNAAGEADDIVSITTTLGGINAIGGPSAITVLDSEVISDGLALGDAFAAVSLFAQNVAGQANLTATSGGKTGVSVGAPVAQGLPKAHFVGAAASGAFVDTVVATAGTHNPTTFVAGTANSFAAGNFWHVNYHDALGFNVLGGQLVSISVATTAGSASLPAFGSVITAQPILANVVTASEVGIAGLGGASTSQGSIAFGLTTSAAAPSAGTITVTFGALVLERAFTATGPAVDLVSVTAPAAAGAGGAVLSANAAGTNPGPSLWAVFIADSAGNGLGAFAPAVVTPSVDTAGQLAFAALVAAPAPAPAGTWNLGITSVVGSVPGTYTVTLTMTTGVTTNDTITFEVIIGGATTSLTHTITDAGGTDVTADPSVGIGELLTIVLTLRDGNGNSPPNATVIGGVGPNLGATAPAGPPTSNTAGTSTVIYAAPVATGIVTFNYAVGAVNLTFTVEVGGVGGQIIDDLAASGDTAIDANVGDQVSLTVIATLLGVATPDAIILFEVNGGSVAPSQVSTNASGEGSTFASADGPGTVIVTATAVSEGVNDLIPVPGVNAVVFTINFGQESAQLSDGAVATFRAWTFADADSSVFENVAGLVAVWKWTGSEWVLYAADPDAPSGLKAVFTLTNGDVIFIVTTGAVTVVLG